MKNNTLKYGVILISLLAPIGIGHAFAQTATSGANGAGGNTGLQGSEDSKEVGAMDDQQAAAFKKYVMGKKHASHPYKDKYVMGSMMPMDGMEMFDVPSDYTSGKYQYVHLNEDWVVIDAKTHKVVQVIH